MSARSEIERLARYGATGLVSLAASAAGYYGFLDLAGFPPLAANTAGFLISLVVSYLLNLKWTFRQGPARRASFAKFSVLVVGSFFVAQAALYLLTHVLGVGPRLAYLWIIPIQPVCNYLGMAWWVFRHRPLAPGEPPVPQR